VRADDVASPRGPRTVTAGTMEHEALCLFCSQTITWTQGQGENPLCSEHTAPDGTACSFSSRKVSDAWALKASLRFVEGKLRALQEHPPGCSGCRGDLSQEEFQTLQKTYQLDLDGLVTALEGMGLAP